ncbi:hypothetical protein GCM10010207_41590 [Streptomyces atratus]|nr:hypothetical protein GCM10010207_41590 [Streptomyces atratus]
MDGPERVGQPGAQDLDRTLGQGAVHPGRPPARRARAAGDGGLEGGPGDIPGRDPGHGGLGVGVQHGGRPGGADLAGGVHFLAEAVAELLLLGELTAYQLDRDGAAAVRPGQIDLAHAAGAEPAQQPVRADGARILWRQALHGADTSFPRD